MRYVVRLLLGAALGIAAVAALTWFGVRWWIAGSSGALLGALGFLGSFFFWSADRPEEGYEQVLFDMPNNLVAGSLIVLLVAGAFGSTFLHHDAPAATVAAPDPALDRAHDNLTAMYNGIQKATYDAPTAANSSAQLATMQAFLAKDTSPRAQLLASAAKSLASALNEFKTCKDKASCALSAQLAKADALPAKKPLDDSAA